MKCTGSLVIPHSEERSEASEVAAEWGKLVHAWAQTGEIQDIGSKRTQSALRRAIEESGIDRLELWPPGGVHEGSIAIAVDGSGKVSRDDAPREGWVTGHYDYHWWMLDGELWVDDLKTGKEYPNPPAWDMRHNPLLSVGENRYPQNVASVQQKTYLLALAELLGYRGDGLVSVTHWPRLPKIARWKPPVRAWHRWSHSELMQHWADLEVMYAIHKSNQAGPDLSLNPGDHCRFCPSRESCLAAKEF